MTDEKSKVEKNTKKRGKKKGSPKTGGRKKGTPNKNSLIFRDCLDASGLNLADEFRNLLDLYQKPEDKERVLMFLVHHCYPQLLAVQPDSPKEEQPGRLKDLSSLPTADLVRIARNG